MMGGSFAIGNEGAMPRTGSGGLGFGGAMTMGAVGAAMLWGGIGGSMLWAGG